MKKIYKSKKFIHFNIKRSEKAMKRLSELKNKKHSYTVIKGRARKRKPNKAKAPEKFSVVHNYEATISFLSNIYHSIEMHKDIYVNLEDVTEITPDAILYLLVLIQESKNRNVVFKGNAPKDKKANSIFISSGFFDFVNSNLDRFQLPQDSSILRIKTGKNVDGDEAANIQNFLKEHVHNIDKVKLMAIYGILVECMSNTNEYAGKTMGSKHWWTMALHNKETGKVLFAFVDNGVGIPSTVRKKWFDNSSDAKLLEKAAMGTYQMSGSHEKTRNKGLPQIRKYNEDGSIQNLVIVSNKGYYSVEHGIKDLEKLFAGTMIAWEFA